MADREKIVRAVKTSFDSWIDKHRNMGLDLHEVERMKQEALELLKEQEPVKPIKTGKGILERTRCGACGSEIANSHFYCWYCGRKVKWDAIDRR